MKVTFLWSGIGALPDAAREIRTTVFMEEQGFVEEFDTIDAQSLHVLLLLDDKAVGTARMFWEDEARGVMRLGRFALRKAVRGGGYGRALLEECCRKARACGACRVVLDAQKRAKEFYLACGFSVLGDEFIEEDYPHYLMEYDLTERGA